MKLTPPQITPGDWLSNFDGDPVQVGNEEGDFVAMTAPCDAACAYQRDYNNARAIAAVPQCLAALADLHRYLTAGPICTASDRKFCLERISAALISAGYKLEP